MVSNDTKATMVFGLFALGLGITAIFGLIYGGLWETNDGVWTIRRIIILSLAVLGVALIASGVLVMGCCPSQKESQE